MNDFKLAWATDTHLDHLANRPERFRLFVKNIQESGATSLLLTGDISNGSLVVDHLEALSRGLGPSFPILFVLGNHDYYGASIAGVRKDVRAMQVRKPNIQWLSDMSFVPLNGPLAPATDEIDLGPALIGHDGWYDGLYSPIKNSQLLMNDFFLIKELKERQKFERWGPPTHYENGALHVTMQLLSQEGASHVEKSALAAISAGHKSIVIATHIPPFPELSLYQGRQSDQHWMPFFSSKLMGDAIRGLVQKHPEVKFTVLCGHSHHAATFNGGFSNLHCLTGGAMYGEPGIEMLFVSSDF